MDTSSYYVNGARPIPFADRDAVKAKLDSLVASESIAPMLEASDNAAPLVCIRKPNGGIRITIDHTHLNRYIRRPTYPVRTPKDAVSEIDSEAIYYGCFDATDGYFQVLLDDESQNLTVFMTPWGRYKCLRAPMGLSSSSD